MKRNNRRAGHKYELDIRRDYEELGYPNAKTSRNESRTRDAGKVDICGTFPYAPQVKYMQNQPDFYALLDSMVIEPGEIPLIHFKRNVGRGIMKEEIVVLKKEDWYKLVSQIKT